jgi:hypothetical protein
VTEKPTKPRAAKPRAKQPSVERTQAIRSAFSIAPAYANSTQISAGIGTVRMAFGEATPEGSHYSHAIVVSARVAERFAKQLAAAAEDAKKRDSDAVAESLVVEQKTEVSIDDQE